MKYLSKEPFSVSGAGNKKYGEGWEYAFGKKRAKAVKRKDKKNAK